MKYKEIQERVRWLRKNMTQAEKALWVKLRKRKLGGFRFLRQHPIFYQRNFNEHNFFVADFYCAECNLVIELDGKGHACRVEYDQWRDDIIRSKNIQVLRIKNEELENMELVLKKILEELKELNT
jgi:very-short-patch-repair endonuclease